MKWPTGRRGRSWASWPAWNVIDPDPWPRSQPTESWQKPTNDWHTDRVETGASFKMRISCVFRRRPRDDDDAAAPGPRVKHDAGCQILHRIASSFNCRGRSIIVHVTYDTRRVSKAAFQILFAKLAPPSPHHDPSPNAGVAAPRKAAADIAGGL